MWAAAREAVRPHPDPGPNPNPNPHQVFSAGDVLTLRFSTPTNRAGRDPEAGELSPEEVEALLAWSPHPTGAAFVANWSDDSAGLTLRVTEAGESRPAPTPLTPTLPMSRPVAPAAVTPAAGCKRPKPTPPPTRATATAAPGSSPLQLGTSVVAVRRSATLRDAALRSIKSSAVSPPIRGEWGSPPRIIALVASDPDAADARYGAGDVISLIFDRETDTPAAGTRVEIDRLLSFSQALGRHYSGEWRDARTLRIHVTREADATRSSARPQARRSRMRTPRTRHATHTPCTRHAHAMHTPCTRHAWHVHMHVPCRWVG